MVATFAWFPWAVPRTRDHGNQLGRRTQAPTQGFHSPSTFNYQKVGVLTNYTNLQRAWDLLHPFPVTSKMAETRLPCCLLPAMLSRHLDRKVRFIPGAKNSAISWHPSTRRVKISNGKYWICLVFWWVSKAICFFPWWHTVFELLN